MHIPRFHRVLLVGLALAGVIGCGGGAKPAEEASPPVDVLQPMAVQRNAPMPARVAVSTPASKPIVQPVILNFTETSIKAIQAGTKTATIRKGVRTFQAGPLRAVGTAGDVVMLTGVTTTSKNFGDLSEADAAANGSASLDELKTQLGKDYPGIAAGDVITVIGFKVGG